MNPSKVASVIQDVVRMNAPIDWHDLKARVEKRTRLHQSKKEWRKEFRIAFDMVSDRFDYETYIGHDRLVYIRTVMLRRRNNGVTHETRTSS